MLPSFLESNAKTVRIIAARLFPNSFKTFGIPRGIESYKNLNPLTIYPSIQTKRLTPKTILEEVHPKHLPWLEHYSNESFVLCLNEGISSSYGANLTKAGMLIAEVSKQTGLKNTDIKKHKVFDEVGITSKTKKHKGSIATITTHGQSNYYHWLLNALPKIHLLDKSGLEYDKIYVEVKTKFQEETLKVLGYESEKIINSSTTSFLSASQLIVPSLPAYNQVGDITAWSCDFLRQRFLARNVLTSALFKNEYKRIYISRADASYRKVINELEVTDFLEKYGFSVVQLGNLSFLDQVKLFRDVEIVVAPHGAGLSNLVFCPEGAKVIEIFASPDYVSPLYWVLSQHIGLDYYYLIGEGKEHKNSGANSRRRNTINFEVDLTKLRETFDLASIT